VTVVAPDVQGCSGGSGGGGGILRLHDPFACIATFIKIMNIAIFVYGSVFISMLRLLSIIFL
jgi:hypothetical protein